MTARCSICGNELGPDAVTFAAGGVVLFRPCDDCGGKVRQVAHMGAELGAKKLKAKLGDLIPPDVRAAAMKAVRIARIVAEED